MLWKTPSIWKKSGDSYPSSICSAAEDASEREGVLESEDEEAKLQELEDSNPKDAFENIEAILKPLWEQQWRNLIWFIWLRGGERYNGFFRKAGNWLTISHSLPML